MVGSEAGATLDTGSAALLTGILLLNCGQGTSSEICFYRQALLLLDGLELATIPTTVVAVAVGEVKCPFLGWTAIAPLADILGSIGIFHCDLIEKKEFKHNRDWHG